MNAEDYMETILEGMERRKTNDDELSSQDDENHFRCLARMHNPRIPDADIENFWEANAHRLS